ncbi:hypothetical protein SHIRM173S_10352 [Streptomyces hirsutus]
MARPEARERYARAGVGVEDKDVVVEIGRPQLDAVRPWSGPPADDARTTVLYAPTWEGWDEPGNTSVVAAGENLVRALLADPGVRLLYKPHPLTGSVEPTAGAADRRIRELIRAANRERPAGASGPAGSASELDRLTAELDRLAAELDRLTAAGVREGADQMERMLAQSAPPPGRAEAVAKATAAWRRRTGRPCPRTSTRSSRTYGPPCTPASTTPTC